MSEHTQHDVHTGLLDVEEAAEVVVLGADEREPEHYERGTFGKIVSGILTLVALIAVTYAVPGLHWAQPWTTNDPVPFWNLIGRELLGEGAALETAARELAQTQEAVRATEQEELGPLVDREIRDPGTEQTQGGYEPDPDDAKPAKQPIDDPSGTALDPFFASLARTDASLAGAVTRAIHWGDSVVGNDGITAAMRRRMQRRFGDAGHGFHLLQPPNASYKHQHVRFSTNGKWSKCFIIEKCRTDGHYGLGGVTFHSVAGAQSRFETARKGPFGRKVSRFEVWYAGQPGGGKLQLKVDRGEAQVIDTAAEELVDRWHAIEVDDGPHNFELRSIGGGKLRAYGVVLERNRPGVVWDGMSLIGAYTNRLVAQDPEHFSSQIQHRDAQLAVLMFGGNDMIRKISMEEYAAEYAEVLKLVRAAKTDMACLVMAPADHGVRKGNRIESNPVVAKMVEAQRRVAHEHGCAFFDTFAAMGGEGSMGRWRRSKPPLASGDLAHLTPAGHKAIGELLYRALMNGYVAYRRRTDVSAGDR